MNNFEKLAGQVKPISGLLYGTCAEGGLEDKVATCTRQLLVQRMLSQKVVVFPPVIMSVSFSIIVLTLVIIR